MRSKRAQPDTIPISLMDAYDELTPILFAAWIRLHTVDPKSFTSRVKLAKSIGYSLSQSNVILRELKLMGYVEILPVPGRGKPTRVRLLRRGLISGGNAFVNLANFTTMDVEAGHKSLADESDFSLDLNTSEKHHILPLRNIKPGIQHDSILSDPKNPTRCNKITRRKMKILDLHCKQSNDAQSHAASGCYVAQQPANIHSRDSVFSSSEFHGGIYSINLNKIKELREQSKKEQSERNSKNRSKGSMTKSYDPLPLATKLDWDKLDQRGKPIITFSPSKKKRKQLIDILNQSPKNPLTREIIKKLGSEFARIYSRYRRLLQKEAGNQPTYLVNPKEIKYATAAAEHCIRKGVTPRQVLAYWHHHIRNFSDAKMLVPPLVFLSSPANIDTVACSDLAKIEDTNERELNKIPKHGNSFSDVSRIDTRVRPTLERAGFVTSEYNDRFILTIQYAARSLALGYNLYVDDDIRGMANHLAKTLYKDLKNEKAKAE